MVGAPERGDVLGTLDWLAALANPSDISSDEDDWEPDFDGWDVDDGEDQAEVEDLPVYQHLLYTRGALGRRARRTAPWPPRG